MSVLTALAAFAAAESLDRIAVTVGKQVVTESQVVRDLRVAAFLDGKPVEVTAEAKRASAERLVEQLLILQEAADSHVTLPSTEAAAGLVARYAAVSQYRTELARYGISEADLAAHLLAGLRAITFMDLRFRPEVQLSEEDLRDYYNRLVTGRQDSAAAAIPSFEESREQIEKLLTDQRVLEALDKWLVMARQAAGVRYREKAFQ